MGRTFRTPILKLEVNCTDACIVAAGCGLATVTGEGLFAGAVGISVVSGMVAGVVVCGNTGLVEIAVGKLDARLVTASATEDLIAAKVGWCETGCSCSIGLTFPLGSAFASAGRAASAPLGILLGSFVVITESSAGSRIAETSSISGVCGTPGRKLSAVCSTTGAPDDSKVGLASGNSGTLGRKVSAICSTTAFTDDSKTGSVRGVNSRCASPLWYAVVCDALPTTSASWSGAPLGFAEGRTVRP